jgi:hypothetical protein
MSLSGPSQVRLLGKVIGLGDVKVGDGAQP